MHRTTKQDVNLKFKIFFQLFCFYFLNINIKQKKKMIHKDFFLCNRQKRSFLFITKFFKLK